MIHTESHTLDKKQNQSSGDTAGDVEKPVSPGLEPVKLPDKDGSEGKKIYVPAAGSESYSIEGCEQGPCPCTGPDCKDGGGGGSTGYLGEDF